jgi:hypothetical protein
MQAVTASILAPAIQVAVVAERHLLAQQLRQVLLPELAATVQHIVEQYMLVAVAAVF